MDVKPALLGRKAMALAVFVALGGFGHAALGSSATHTGTLATNGVTTTQASPSSGFELDYFHTYKASQTYAIALKNGLRALFDFKHGTATIYDTSGGQRAFPLEQALLEASNGDGQAAAEMYNQMKQSLDTVHADAVTDFAGVSAMGTHVSPHPPTGGVGGIGDFGDPTWASPSGGSCWPVTFPCNEWSGALTNFGPTAGWGMYNDWWGSSFGDPPPTSEPPRPDGCDPHDLNCIVWEHDRQSACDDLIGDSLLSGGAAVAAGLGCGSAVGSGGGLTLACVGGLAAFSGAEVHRQKHLRKCRTPYPG